MTTRTPARWIAVTTSATIAALALALSFVALSTLASWAGWGHWESKAWAVVVDGLIVVATLSVYADPHRRAYPWAILSVASLGSLAGNVTHAVLAPGALAVGLSAAIAATPPLAHLVATHLTVRLLHTPTPIGHVTEPDVLEPFELVDCHDDPAPIPTPEPDPEPVAGEPTPAPDEPGDDRRTRALEAIAAGMTQRQAAEMVGVTERTIRRWQTAA
ncbi:helix-turn-helix domain-containing protein [Rhodococcus sp. YH1]|uniref:helix-turn-helix domain-containing protein n=1 Tax=Rhodococcus sp. YH1 TaxID=89066 RepID=UPI001386E3A2|nr:hypothetical protein [Rhodococcus sp. YH1]